jgi:diguanylate cyclase (GGDEF)-like protein
MTGILRPNIVNSSSFAALCAADGPQGGGDEPLFQTMYDPSLSPAKNLERFQGLSPQEMALELLVLATQVSEQARQIAALEKAVKYDSLTQIFNRGAFEESLEGTLKDLKRARDIPERRHAKGVYLLMVDLDGFKQINDTHGHDTGDVVLQKVAHALAENVREGDIAARLGGDEFAVILKGTDARNAEVVGQKIQNALNALTYDFQGIDYKIKTSIGGVVITADMDTRVAKDAADKDMYRVKKEKGETRSMPPEPAPKMI